MDTLDNRIQKRLHVSLYALLFLTVLLGLSVLLEGCSDTCEATSSYVYYEPVFTPLATVRAGVEVTAPQPIRGVGKLYFKDNFIFINEPGEGIHIIDNQRPEQPVVRKFIRIPGNYDLAIRDNILYADSYIDLVAFDIADLETIKEINRVENLFSNYNSMGFFADETRGVVTAWTEKSVNVETAECDQIVQPWGGFWFAEGIALRADASVNFSSKAAIAPGNGSGSGLGGSLARFTVSDEYLYLLDAGEVKVVDVSIPASPAPKGSTYVSWDIETIFPYGQHLFVGARSGMHILDIATPDNPSLISTYAHVNSCDPVVVDGDRAYVTLRSGNPTCEGFTNQLEVIDIRDLSNPRVEEIYEMTNPHGLGVDGDLLFVCDGPAGLKVYNKSDIRAIDKNLLYNNKEMFALDVIPLNNLLMMITEDGLVQLDYADPSKLKILSYIPVLHEE